MFNQEVEVRAKKDLIDSISNAKAIIDLDNIENIYLGKYTLEDLPVFVYDKNDKKLKNVEVNPSKVDAIITITDK